MHILFVGTAGPTERDLILKACKVNTLEHQEILQPSLTTPFVPGPMGIWREAPTEDLDVRVAKEMELLNALDPRKVAGIVFGGFGMRIKHTRFNLARNLQTKHPSIPVLAIEEPSMMAGVIQHYGGGDCVTQFEGLELTPPRVHIITKGPKVAEHIHAFISLCARRLSAS